MKKHHLGQLNVARMRAPLESPLMAAFVASLDEINRLADSAPGFIWRLQSDAGDATALRPIGDDMLVNMSVWSGPEALRDFVYRSAHAAVMRRRRDWFNRLAEAYMVLWWVPCGHVPTISEATERLSELRRLGPTRRAFTFRELFLPDGARPVPAQADQDPCSAI